MLLFALGIGTITLLLLATTQLDQRMHRDAQGIDLVIGAKGSPLQIILSAIYHLDVPTGNIAYKQAKEIAAHRAVKKTIPLALGDSYRGFRIAGTTHDYVAHYGATMATGRLWQNRWRRSSAPNSRHVPGTPSARNLLAHMVWAMAAMHMKMLITPWSACWRPAAPCSTVWC